MIDSKGTQDRKHRNHGNQSNQRPFRPVRSRLVTLVLEGTALATVLAGCVSSAPEDRKPTSSSDAAAINVQLGVDYLRQGDLALAQTKLQRALREDPHSADAHGAMALLDERLGKSADADKEYREALKLSGNSPAMMNNYAVYLCSHGMADQGVRYAEEAASNPLYRTPWAAYNNAGVCLRAVHRDAEAMERFTRALQSNPGFVDAVFEAASLDYSLQHYVQARLRLDLYLMDNAATPDLLLLAWRIAAAQNDRVGQQRYGARLQKEFPQSGQARALGLAASRSTPD